MANATLPEKIDVDCHLTDDQVFRIRQSDDTVQRPLAQAVEHRYNSHAALVAFAERFSDQPCEYTGSAGCNLLPSGVRRSVCNPCQARALLAQVEGKL